MKKLILFTFVICISFLFAKKDTAEIDRVFDSISKPRVGLLQGEITGLNSPFSLIKKVVKSDDNSTLGDGSYVLSAIVADKARINKKWYKIGQELDIYKLSEIQKNKVKLVSGSEEMMLFMYPEDQNQKEIKDIVIEVK